MRYLPLLLLVIAAPALAEDAILLRDGTTKEGNILFWDESSYVISIQGHAQHVPISDIAEIRYESGSVIKPSLEKPTNTD